MLTTTNSFTQSQLHYLEEYAGSQNLGSKIQKGAHRFLLSAFRTARSAIFPHYDNHFATLYYYLIDVSL